MNDLWLLPELIYDIYLRAMSCSLTGVDKNVAISEFNGRGFDRLGDQNSVTIALNPGIQ